MLNEAEWEALSPYLTESVHEVKAHRERFHSTISEARAAGFGSDALEPFFKLTGHLETNPDNLWWYRLASYGPPCGTCGKPLQTP